MHETNGSAPLMPVLFIGHGHPINAIRQNAFTEALKAAGKRLPRPEAILVISAHWLTRNNVIVSATELPSTIYDFGPFHPDIFKVVYPAPGAPGWAKKTARLIRSHPIGINTTRGLDHGAWTILKHLLPAADIPTYQLSIDFAREPRFHYELGRELKPLRGEGVLIVGSGNIVHNLMRVDWENPEAETDGWARQFDETVRGCILKGDHARLMSYEEIEFGDAAVPTNDHYLPMLYALSLQEKGETVSFLFEGFQYGTISMRCLRIG